MSRFRSIRPELVARDPATYTPLLVHENAFLRARLEGKGRLEVDPTLKRELEGSNRRNEVAASKIERLETEVARLRSERGRLESRAQQLQQQLERMGADRDRLQQVTAGAGGDKPGQSPPSIVDLHGGQVEMQAALATMRNELTALRSEVDESGIAGGRVPLAMSTRRTIRRLRSALGSRIRGQRQ